jgi:hypothetical protein
MPATPLTVTSRAGAQPVRSESLSLKLGPIISFVNDILDS